MISIRKEFFLGVLIGCLAWIPVALAVDAPAQQSQPASAAAPAASADAAAMSMKKDATCTRCYDESETNLTRAM